MIGRCLLLGGLAFSLLLGCASGDGPKTAREIQEEAKRAPAVDDTDYSEVGVAIYPGATVPAELPPIVRSATNEGVTIDLFRETTDSVEQVAAFYKERLTDASETGAGSGVAVEGLSPTRDRVRVTANRPAKATKTALVISVIKKSGQDQKPKD